MIIFTNINKQNPGMTIDQETVEFLIDDTNGCVVAA